MKFSSSFKMCALKHVCVCVYIYIYTYICTCMYIYVIYIYIKDRQLLLIRQWPYGNSWALNYLGIYTYICVYINIYRERRKDTHIYIFLYML